jgi:histidine triad (HIT) family protein
MPNYEPNIFTKIIDGEIPCHKVYEDDHCLAFLDIGPLAEGHTLLIPKEHATHMHDLSEEAGAAVGRVLPKLCRAVTQATGAKAYNVLVNTGRPAGQLVMHVHIHIIPKFDDSGLQKNWNAGELEDERAKALVERMQQELKDM